jgi:hypothetical protein
MSEKPPQETEKPARIDLKREIARSEWKDDPVIGFDQKASLTIARWVLMIFGGVYVLSFLAMFFLFYRSDATFEKGSELVKFMVQSLLPLVTLAVGYYLGDRNRHQQSPVRNRK